MGPPRHMTDMELQAFARQRAEARRAVLVLLGVVGGLAGLAAFLVISSRATRDELASSSPKADAKASASAVPAPPAPAPAASPAPEPSFASTADVQRAVREQKAERVAACVAKSGRKARKAQITVKLEVAAPDKVSKLDVVTSPKVPALARCVRAEFKDVTLPRVASSMTVAVPFKSESARGRRPGI